MTPSVRISVANRLADLGLRKTLIVVKGDSGYAVSRIRKLDSSVELTPMGSFSSEHVPVIGRVGIPHPQLGIFWKNSMSFYGKWFDNVGDTDAGYRVRRNISSLSHKRQLEQIGRDDQYALVGSYYSVFQTIMDVKRRVPLVLIDDTYLSLVSFPVVLPKIEDKEFEKELLDVLRRLLRPDKPDYSDPAIQSAGIDGIEVDEISTDDIDTYFPPDKS